MPSRSLTAKTFSLLPSRHSATTSPTTIQRRLRKRFATAKDGNSLKSVCTRECQSRQRTVSGTSFGQPRRPQCSARGFTSLLARFGIETKRYDSKLWDLTCPTGLIYLLAVGLSIGTAEKYRREASLSS